MTASEARARAFYDRLGAGGLAARTTDAWDRMIVARVRAMLPPGARVLDAGCGYGRVAVPLAQQGWGVVGLDIAPALLADARRRARRAGVTLPLVEGSLLDPPIREGTVDVVLSLWSAFYELTAEAEQRRALAALYAVLRPGGFAIVEGPPPLGSSDRDAGTGRIASVPVQGVPCETFRHDAATLERLARDVGVARHEVYVADWAGRPRQLLRVSRA